MVFTVLYISAVALLKYMLYTLLRMHVPKLFLERLILTWESRSLRI